MPSTRDQRPYNVAYYAKNRDAEIERVTRRQQATLAWLRELRNVPCMDCGAVFPPWVMDFDHRDPKTKSFNVMSGKVLLKNRYVLQLEIAKCDVVCANCHRARTHAANLRGELLPPPRPRRDETPRRVRTREKVARVRAEQVDLLRAFRANPCFDCGRRFPWYVMDFDHREPSSKTGDLNTLVGRVGLVRLLDEVAKCDIVCANCHRERTYVRRSSGGCVVAAASDSSKVEVRVRLPSPAPEQLRLIEESGTPYRIAA